MLLLIDGHSLAHHSKNVLPSPETMDTYQHLAPFAEQNSAQKSQYKYTAFKNIMN
jgi:hypothetical protein